MMSNKKRDFNNYRFEGLNWKEKSNKYMTMNRVSEDEDKVVISVSTDSLIKTRYGYAFILDRTHVVFLKDWQVDMNYFANEVLLNRDFFNVKEWGTHDEYDDEEDLSFEKYVEVAKAQTSAENKVAWAI